MIEIRYSKHIDLLYHALAHLKVNNASDCYDERYVRHMQDIKQEFDYSIKEDMRSLQVYYNENFERLAMVNFLPFYSRDFGEMKSVFLNYNGFTQEDMLNFIIPFSAALDNESPFFFGYWEQHYNESGRLRGLTEYLLAEKFIPYRCMFDYCGKTASAILSYTITRNGRGFRADESKLSALAPFPRNEGLIDNTFFVLLHEYTHHITDHLIQNINMRDNTHDISENVVILTDYYLIKSVNSSEMTGYFKWLVSISGHNNRLPSESEFLSMFQVDESINTQMMELITHILN